mmetsp:Transcript_101937/g.186119  ORF Transcript_101937/g.186119 Transcript_101937/m.186119 type:complete len:175 (-) Transcript_101937:36-560(-)
MSGGLTGPKAHELRSALGGKTAGTGKTVETPVQSGRSSRADKDQDRQNKGFSGTPLWKIKKNLEAASEAASLKPGSAVPDGFALHDGDLYWSEKRQVFWQQSTGRFLVFDERANSYAELHEGLNFELSILAGGAMQDGPTQGEFMHGSEKDKDVYCSGAGVYEVPTFLGTLKPL